VPPNLELLLFIDVLLHKVPQNVIFDPVGVQAKFFYDLKGGVNQKKVEKHWIKGIKQ
jgi:hypothetical protein